MNSIIHTINIDMSRHPPPILQRFTLAHYLCKAKTTVLFTLFEVTLESTHRKYVKEISRAEKINCLHLSNPPSKLNKMVLNMKVTDHLEKGQHLHSQLYKIDDTLITALKD